MGQGSRRPEGAGCGEPCAAHSSAGLPPALHSPPGELPPPRTPSLLGSPFPSERPQISRQVPPRPSPQAPLPAPFSSPYPPKLPSHLGRPPALHLRATKPPRLLTSGRPGSGLWAVDAPNRLWDSQPLPRGRGAALRSLSPKGMGAGTRDRPEIQGPAQPSGFRVCTDPGRPEIIHDRPSLLYGRGN